MNTINCRILVNEYQDLPGRDVTPAEALLLRHIHDAGAATQSKLATNDAEKANCWKFLRNVTAAGVAMTENEETGKKRERTNAEEVARLRRKYLMRGKSGAHDSHILDDLFPGMNPDLPETFEEIGLEVQAPVEKKATKKTTEPTA